jgi:hypothetical protein
MPLQVFLTSKVLGLGLHNNGSNTGLYMADLSFRKQAWLPDKIGHHCRVWRIADEILGLVFYYRYLGNANAFSQALMDWQADIANGKSRQDTANNKG